jgi:hypothetical protein
MGGPHDTVGPVGLDPNGFTSTTTLRRRQGQGERRHARHEPPPRDTEDSVTIGGEPAEADAAPVVPPPPAHPTELPLPAWDKVRRF